MKVSLNWIREYTDIDISVDELVAKIGAQLGAVEEVVDLSPKYARIVNSRIVSCEKHPNADKLSVCLIDDGGKTANVDRNDKGLVQVVCGAPNAREGLFVAWLPPGTVVPSTYDKEPFSLEAREIRGVISNGMLASAAELALGDDHSGIVELPVVDPGSDFAELFGLNDVVIDIENKMFTHRPDCFGIIGVAREIAGITSRPFKSPDVYTEAKTTGPHPSDESKLQIENRLGDKVPRFMAQIFEGVSAKESSIEMKAKLIRVGLKPVNHIVDVTNYFMYLTGQPLHAYDYDKLLQRTGGKQPKIIIRQAQAGEKLTLLGGKEIVLDEETAVVIADEKGAIGLGGVMGGKDTEVDSGTQKIVLECATFDMYSIRRASMRYGLFTDAVTRFSKGQSIHQNDRVLAMAAAELVKEGASPSRSIFDIKKELPPPNTIEVTSDFINARLGHSLKAEKMKNMLANVEFKVEAEANKLKVTCPFWRTDISIREDIVEEIGRLYGYEKMPTELPKRTLSPASPEETLLFKSEIRRKMASGGANEILTYSFVHGKLLDVSGQQRDLAFRITNAISPELQYYRVSLTPSLLAHVHSNIRSGYDRFALFEINKTHNKMHTDDDGGVPKEYDILSLVFADKSDRAAPAFYNARAHLDELCRSLGIETEYKTIEKEVDYPVAKPFEASRSALVFASGSNISLGIIGEYKSSVRRNLKLPKACAGFEIGIQELMAAARSDSGYVPLSRFPGITQDICLQVADTVSYGELTKRFESLLKSNTPPSARTESSPIDIYSSDQISGKKRFTYRVKLTSYDRTLTEDILSGLLEKIAATLGSDIGAERI